MAKCLRCGDKTVNDVCDRCIEQLKPEILKRIPEQNRKDKHSLTLKQKLGFIGLFSFITVCLLPLIL